MSTKLYIGNLGFEVTEAELKELFSQHGKVESVKIITDRHSGRSRGFAFIEMSSKEEAAQAIEKLNGYNLKDREIAVAKARPPQTNRLSRKTRFR